MNKVPKTIEEIDQVLEDLRKEYQEKPYKRRMIKLQADMLKRA